MDKWKLLCRLMVGLYYIKGDIWNWWFDLFEFEDINDLIRGINGVVGIFCIFMFVIGIFCWII